MWLRIKRVLLALVAVVLIGIVVLAITGVPAPPSFKTENAPRISWKWAWKSVFFVRQFQSNRQFAAWYGDNREMLITVGTRGAIHLVSEPGAKPKRLAGIPVGATRFRWSRDVPRPYLIYARDEGGNERFRLFRFDVKTGQSTPLTTVPARAYASGLDPEGRRLAFASNERNGTDSDLYLVDVEKPGSKTIIFRAAGDYMAGSWTADGRFLVVRMTGMDRRSLFLFNPTTSVLQPVLKPPGASTRFVAAVRSRSAARMYLAADLGREFTGVHSLSLDNLEIEALTPDLRWDVVDMEALADGRTLALLVNEDAQYRLYLLDLEKRQLRRAQGVPPGFPTRIVAHPTLPIIALDVIANNGATGVWTYDVAAARSEPWSVASSAEGRPDPEVIRYPTFDTVDGVRRTVPAIVAKPPRRKAGRLPVVIEIHGGPAMQSLACVLPPDPVVYADVAVIRPNVRGSTGYGSTYESLDDGAHREDAVRDIGSLLDWIATQPDLDPARVAVMGGSYGGYMVLETLVHYSDRVRCGWDMFGISDLPAFLEESEKGHFPEAQRGEYGDGRDPAMRQFLLSISPATQADRIRVPLMVYQGANDVRVKPQQSRAMVRRIREAGGHVTYLEVANEGHGMNQPLTQFYVGMAGGEFMERCLGR